MAVRAMTRLPLVRLLALGVVATASTRRPHHAVPRPALRRGRAGSGSRVRVPRFRDPCRDHSRG